MSRTHLLKIAANGKNVSFDKIVNFSKCDFLLFCFDLHLVTFTLGAVCKV